ncbi:hypothetical protein [Streptomyces triticirhizae]|uniref:Uncharacterized protein n=1 Tax=Streptomyces triticirhizae TaxID=2483353 RepID=A0A3M2LJP6_9ACTN|nr:hypothetical protein [Streptomyces triticirhizae]RMI37707.1 hypothetical protein EBN88_18505 [Streptomyces triticirhizae]
MDATVDAEQAWRDLQRIRVPQERVYDEAERCASSGLGTTWATAALMWVFLASMGLELPWYGVLLAAVVYVALLGWLVVAFNRRSRMRLHRSRYTWHTVASMALGGVLTGGTVLLSGWLVDSLHPGVGALIQATATAGVFVLFAGPVNRWTTGALRGHAERVGR